MTSQERIEAALLGQPVDRVPFCPFLAYVWESFPQHVRDPGQLAFHHRIGADPLWRGAPCVVRARTEGVDWEETELPDGRLVQITTPVGSLSMRWQRSDRGNTAFLIEHPLKTEEDFKVQTWIEQHTRLQLDESAARQHLANGGREGLSLGMLIPRAKSAYQTLIEHLVGTEELAYALADFPDTVDTLWRTMVQRDLEAVRLSAECDLYRYYITWEDSSTQNYSPAQYDRYIGSEIGQWCRTLAGHGKSYIQHACGHLRHILLPMKQQGILAVESISAAPTGNIELDEARRIAGREMGIIGGIEPTHFLNLSDSELGPYVEQIIAQAAGGPFVLANSDSCPPGVTEAKFKRAADVARSVRA